MATQEVYHLAEKIGTELSKKKWTITTAESCTGGGIACAVTDIAGSSGWFGQAVVTYSNSAKQALLKVSADTLERYGAVSEQTVEEMLAGVMDLGSAEVAIAVSGIAGPGGGTEEKPVGTVYIGCAVLARKQIKKFYFTGGRRKVRDDTVKYSLLLALEMLTECREKS